MNPEEAKDLVRVLCASRFLQGADLRKEADEAMHVLLKDINNPNVSRESSLQVTTVRLLYILVKALT